jgi:hypothetical protein
VNSPQSKTLTTAELGEAAVLIREHLWLGKTPPPPPHPSEPPWHMGRDLSIYKRLLASGRQAEQINLAIRHVRSVLMNHAGVPLRMTIFYNGFSYATPLFEQALGIAYKAEESNYKSAKKLPPSVRSILREMVG